MRFTPKKKKKETRNQKWEVLDFAFDLLEPLYLLMRFVIRSIVKIIN
ncbi:MAG: hypothetical protein ABF649_19310 [Bacillus sp. (in: firmicutes)]